MDERAVAFEQQAEAQFDIEVDIHAFPEGTETAADAAAAVGCDIAAVARTLVFVADTTVVVIASGANTVDTRKLATLRGVHEARMADPEEVVEVLGWEVGGVPPFCHDTPVPVYLDETLTAQEEVWVAAGSPRAVFPLTPETLVDCTDAEVVDITR